MVGAAPKMNKKEADVIALKNFQATPAAFTLPHVTGAAVMTWTPPAAPVRPRPVRVSLVASDPAARQAMSQQLAADPRTELVAWARTLREGWRLAEPAEVLLVERELEDGDGLDLVRHLKDACPAAEAIVVAQADDEEAALRAFDVGAAGWLVLRDGLANFVLAVLNVANGGAALSPSLARRLMRRPAQGDARSMLQSTLAAITDREREVLAQIAHGLRSKEIARELAISDETVNAHVKSIYRKLQVHSRAQLVRVASQAGIC